MTHMSQAMSIESIKADLETPLHSSVGAEVPVHLFKRFNSPQEGSLLQVRDSRIIKICTLNSQKYVL